jgi:hypothetical protein
MARFLRAQAPTMLAVHFFHVDSAVTLNGSTSSSLWKSATATSTSSGEDGSGGDTSREFSSGIHPLRAAVSWAGVVVARRRRERPLQELSSVSKLCLPCRSICIDVDGPTRV